MPEYAIVAVHGEAHLQSFEVVCRIEALNIAANGTGASRRAAEQAAAAQAYEQARRELTRSATPAFRCGQVAIVGKPSVGKSTLLNALVGARIAITSRRPQTTRHRLRGILTTAQAQFIFVDTPGFQTRHRSRLNERMNRAVRDSVTDVDVTVVVFEAKALAAADRDVVALLPAAVPAIAAVNKVDRLADRRPLLPLLAEVAAAREFAAIVPVSAEKQWQLDVLTREIAACLPPGPPLYPAEDLTDRDERFLAAEYVREKIFRLLGEELPYAAAVMIDRFMHERRPAPHPGHGAGAKRRASARSCSATRAHG